MLVYVQLSVILCQSLGQDCGLPRCNGRAGCTNPYVDILRTLLSAADNYFPTTGLHRGINCMIGTSHIHDVFV